MRINYPGAHGGAGLVAPSLLGLWACVVALAGSLLPPCAVAAAGTWDGDRFATAATAGGSVVAAKAQAAPRLFQTSGDSVRIRFGDLCRWVGLAGVPSPDTTFRSQTAT